MYSNLFIQNLPKINVTNGQKRNEVCFSPHSAHAQFARHHLLCEVVFQHAKQEEIIGRRLDAVTVHYSVDRNLNVSSEAHLDMLGGGIPISLRKI